MNLKTIYFSLSMKKPNFLLTLISYVLFPALIHAQGITLSGSVQDSLQKLPYATVLVSDSLQFETGTTTDEQGNFSLTLPNKGRYYLQVEFVGYQTFGQWLELQQDHHVDITLRSDLQLQEVTITASRPAIDMGAGRLTATWQNPEALRGMTTQEALKRLPLLKKQGEGLPQVLGKSQTVYYINGKRSLLSAQQIQMLLESMPAEEIDRIEIIMAPGAEYDEGGDTAIVKIYFKTNKLLTKYYLTLRDQQGMYNTPGLFANLIQHKTWQIQASAYSQLSRYGQTIDQRFELPQDKQSLVKVFDSREKNNSWKNGINLSTARSWQEQHELQLSGNASYNTNHFDPNNSYSYNEYGALQNGAYSITESGYTNTTEKEFSKSGSADIQYAFRHGKEQKNKLSLTFSTLFSESAQHRHSLVELDGNNGSSVWDFRQDVAQNQSSLYGRIDYLAMLNEKMSLQAGFYSALTRTASVVDWFDKEANNYQNNPGRSFIYDFNEWYFTPFISWKANWSERFQTDLGVKYDRTINEGFSSEQRLFNNEYRYWMPNLSVLYAPSDMHQFSLSIKGSMQRPAFWQLNPIRYYLARDWYQQENPFLQPSYTLSSDLYYVFGGAIALIGNYSYIENDNAQLTLSNQNNETYLYRDNYGDKRQWNIGIAGGLPLSEKWTVSLTALYQHERTLPRNEYAFLKRNYGFWYFELNQSLQLIDTGNRKLSLTADFTYIPGPLYEGNIRINSLHGLDVGASYTHGRYTLRASVSDIWKGYAYEGGGTSGNQNWSFYNYNDSRRLSLSLRVELGNRGLRSQDINIDSGDIKQRSR
ncbi:outer membrane beta-barrel protein [Thermonema rossianum]|uniref:outer membrane beta-barrel protein n=1 Tax=Thermonema rossianum TaxID=55505 RepID=UPI0012F81B40|nr:outer membrane beta-barrel family protein [Thermonema rossianum]